jgi:hypothetical protein
LTDTLVCHTTVLDHPDQTLTVEWDRDAAAWNRHWLMVFNGASGCRQVVRRLASYTEALRAVQAHLDHRAERITA